MTFPYAPCGAALALSLLSFTLGWLRSRRLTRQCFDLYETKGWIRDSTYSMHRDDIHVGLFWLRYRREAIIQASALRRGQAWRRNSRGLTHRVSPLRTPRWTPLLVEEGLGLVNG